MTLDNDKLIEDEVVEFEWLYLDGEIVPSTCKATLFTGTQAKSMTYSEFQSWVNALV